MKSDEPANRAPRGAFALAARPTEGLPATPPSNEHE
jgi:hypothetical protein